MCVCVSPSMSVYATVRCVLSSMLVFLCTVYDRTSELPVYNKEVF